MIDTEEWRAGQNHAMSQRKIHNQLIGHQLGTSLPMIFAQQKVLMSKKLMQNNVVTF